MAVDFKMHQGDSKAITIVVDEDGTAVDLAGTSIRWSLARSADDPALVEKSTGAGITIEDAAGGVFLVTLLPGDTVNLEGWFYHEAKVIDVDGHPSTVRTGRVRIFPSLITFP